MWRLALVMFPASLAPLDRLLGQVGRVPSPQIDLVGSVDPAYGCAPWDGGSSIGKCMPCFQIDMVDCYGLMGPWIQPLTLSKDSFLCHPFTWNNIPQGIWKRTLTNNLECIAQDCADTYNKQILNKSLNIHPKQGYQTIIVSGSHMEVQNKHPDTDIYTPSRHISTQGSKQSCLRDISTHPITNTANTIHKCNTIQHNLRHIQQ